MALPALTRWLKQWIPDSNPIALNLKADQWPVTFNPRDVDWYLRNGYPRLASLLMSGMPSQSGEIVNTLSALAHSAVWACNRIISESIGFLPAILYQDMPTGKRIASEKPMYRAMKLQPNDDITAQAFSEMLTSHCLLHGNGYAKIIRRSGSGEALELQPLIPEQVMPDRERNGERRLFYTVKESGRSDVTYFVNRGRPQDILHLRGLGWDGIRGWDVITVGRNAIGAALAEEKNMSRFWAMGGRVAEHIEHPTHFRSAEDFKNFRTDWQETYSVPHQTPILENGMKLVKDGTTMRDAQSIESRQFTVSIISRLFSVSPDLIADLSRATFSNIEHLSLRFVKMTLTPWLTRWEQDFSRCVLTPEERSQNYYLRHNLNALLRGDFKTRMEGYASALQNGHMNIDEVRDLEERNPLPDGAGSQYHIQLNMQTVGAVPDAPVEPSLDGDATD